MFLGPLGDGGDFRDEGVTGPRRFLERMWLLVGDAIAPAAGRDAPPSLIAKWHRAKHRATEGMESLRYNTAIAALMELLNAVKEEGTAPRALVEEMIVMLAPFAPHFAEECWERLGHGTSVFDARWPAFDPALVVESTVEIVVQVNGKTRSKITVPRDADEATVLAAALADEGTKKFLEGKEPKKKIYVPGRLVNIVV
jgi:leucyl-tRNA synthetase